jgi:hypothetical protein
MSDTYEVSPAEEQVAAELKRTINLATWKATPKS